VVFRPAARLYSRVDQLGARVGFVEGHEGYVFDPKGKT